MTEFTLAGSLNCSGDLPLNLLNRSSIPPEAAAAKEGAGRVSLECLRLSGSEARRYASELAELRVKVFAEFPYLYAGTEDYERGYLERYFRAERAFIFLVRDAGKPVGATTGIWAAEEEASFREPLLGYGLDPKEVFYFGESVLLPAYRGQGLGKRFFTERERYARTLPSIRWLAFAAVVRPAAHPLRPRDYKSLDGLWKAQGFIPAAELKTSYSWQDINESAESAKEMQFWLKHLDKATP